MAGPPMSQTTTSPGSTNRYGLRKPRKRTRRACDKCNTSRTRCNGDHPCGRCKEYGYDCNYNRLAKKRGRVPKKDKDRQQQTEEYSSPSSSTAETASPSKDSGGVEDAIHVNYDVSTIGESYSVSSELPSSSGIAPTPLIFAETPRLDDYGRQQPCRDIQTSHTSTDLPRLIDSYHLAGSLNDSLQGSSPGNCLFDAPNPTLNFGLSIPTELDRSPPSNSYSECRHRCLEPLLPFIGRKFPVSVACDLFDVYLLDPGASLWRFSSPFILTRVFRRKSLTGPNPRHLSPALLATMLWCCAQTADISVLLVPGSRSKLTNALYEMATYLVSRRDPDRWRRIHGGLQVEYDREPAHVFPETTGSNEPAGTIDDVLTFILLCIGVSAGDFKSDCLKWWSKAKRLALALRLDRQDATSDHSKPPASLAEIEAQEERRRVFWLLYSLDRHLALSYNRALQIPDAICDVYAPLPEYIWENLDDINDLPPRVPGPPVTITGTGFFEYFLPLMVILGDIIEVHHGQFHPRLGSLDKKYAEGVIAELITGCEASLEHLARKFHVENSLSLSHAPMRISDIVTAAHDSLPGFGADTTSPSHDEESGSNLNIRLVVAYSTFILHVLHVLFHGKWDAISMLDNEDDWITTPRFVECASHAIEASEAVADILRLDPELTFMPYLFGIYLLHGSFILLLFADRMPQLGQNQSVEQACETIIRAHEVCVVTLSTEFQARTLNLNRDTTSTNR